MAYTDDDLTVSDLLKRCLAALENVYQTAGLSLPDRRYWTVGQAAWDCEQATVSLLQTYLGTPGNPADTPTHCNTPRTAVIAIAIVRSTAIWDGDAPPSPQDIQNAAGPVAVDVWHLYEVANQCDIYNTGVIVTVDTLQPEGGLHGAAATISIQI